MRTKILAFLREETGLTMVEYAVGGALILVAAYAGIKLVGTNTLATFNTIAGYL